MRIYKYAIANIGNVAISMPAGAKILHIKEQDGQPCVWALTDPDQKRQVWREFQVVMTGSEFDPTGMEYVGTVHLAAGSFVLHVFVSLENGA